MADPKPTPPTLPVELVRPPEAYDTTQAVTRYTLRQRCPLCGCGGAPLALPQVSAVGQ